MAIEEQLKELILSNYKSVRAFTIAANIPYSTVDNIFKRGIGGTAVTTVMRICDILEITVDGITRGVIEPKATPPNIPALTSSQTVLLSAFDQLNGEGQGKAVEYVEDLVATGHYKKSCEPGLGQKEA